MANHERRPPSGRDFAVFELAYIESVDGNLSFGRYFFAVDQLHERRFAGARRSDDIDEFVAVDDNVNPLKSRRSIGVGLPNVLHINHV